jgi:phosphopantothenoylcysteine decarboxylase/phosphopantothenate--cysteine ligase
VVTLISGPVALQTPPVETYVKVTTAEEMFGEVKNALEGSQWLIMAAAVADFRPSEPRREKLKKGGVDSMTLELSRNPDILETLSELKEQRLFIGFAAETGDLIASAQRKIRQKKLDLIVANDISGDQTGFASDHNAAAILDVEGILEDLPRMPKRVMADRILDHALKAWQRRRDGAEGK